jgi:hypothetical protein
MLNRQYHPAGSDATRHLVKFYVRVAIGASGAVSSTYGKGVTVAKSATGRYTATITGNTGLGKVLDARCTVVSTTGQVSWVRSIVEATGVVTFSVAANTAPQTEAEPGDGDHLLICIIVRKTASENS